MLPGRKRENWGKRVTADELLADSTCMCIYVYGKVEVDASIRANVYSKVEKVRLGGMTSGCVAVQMCVLQCKCPLEGSTTDYICMRA